MGRARPGYPGPMADDLPAQPERQRRPIQGGFDFMVRGWRPAAGWACAAVILVRGGIIPLIELGTGRDVTPMDWVSLIALIGALGLARYRHLEKTSGTSI